MKAIVYKKIRPTRGSSTQRDETMNSTEHKSNNFIVRRPLLAYFVLSYAFFWGFLALIIAILGMLRLQPDALPAWGDADHWYSRFLDAQSRCRDRDRCYRRS